MGSSESTAFIDCHIIDNYLKHRMHSNADKWEDMLFIADFMALE